MVEKIYISIGVEDILSEVVLKTILTQTAPSVEIVQIFNRGGHGYLRKNIKAFNHSAKGQCYLILTDLDEYSCAIALIKDWIGVPFHPNMLFRIAVREVESWLLAHRGPFADFLGVPKVKLPVNPDVEDDPKRCLINLARTSRNSKIVRGIVPGKKSTAMIGPDYNDFLTGFVRQKWSADEAAEHSPSLKRCLNRLKSFTQMV